MKSFSWGKVSLCYHSLVSIFRGFTKEDALVPPRAITRIAPTQGTQAIANRSKSGFKSLAHQDRHPERSEGSRSEILRCAQNDSPEKFHGKVYQCLEFWFRGADRSSSMGVLGTGGWV